MAQLAVIGMLDGVGHRLHDAQLDAKGVHFRKPMGRAEPIDRQPDQANVLNSAGNDELNGSHWVKAMAFGVYDLWRFQFIPPSLEFVIRDLAPETGKEATSILWN